ncbi:DODA-type extradiol aromatic ring-opening family dioxygenase [Humitalea sp. 24SJ18S-53]|uniref:DODA-type extradiol aromatic ring-opening family dioxygenase n=1 Tax=Humitalea sp. 24SJ18S-53 TaxID=3422307 RepID=UPI003D67F66B
MPALPALFVSHGAPTLALQPSPARDFLAGYGSELGKPAAIVVVSAHWETARPRVTAAASPETIHDFHGFPRELHAMRYPAPGDPALASRTAALLTAAGLGADPDPRRGLDHGAWVPLVLMYPDATVPVLQVSVQHHGGPAHHLALGQALRPLREEGVLIIGSGSLTHNLHDFAGQAVDAPPLPYVVAFGDWAGEAITQGRTADLLAYRSLAPQAARAHPTEEHFLPLFAAMGAGTQPGRRVHAGHTHGILAMDVFAFD